MAGFQAKNLTFGSQFSAFSQVVPDISLERQEPAFLRRLRHVTIQREEPDSGTRNQEARRMEEDELPTIVGLHNSYEAKDLHDLARTDDTPRSWPESQQDKCFEGKSQINGRKRPSQVRLVTIGQKVEARSRIHRMRELGNGFPKVGTGSVEERPRKKGKVTMSFAQ